MRALYRFALLLLLGASLLMPAAGVAAATLDALAVPRSFPCYGGARPPARSLCMAVPVRTHTGAPARRVPVTVTFGKQSRTVYTGQTPDQPVGAAVAAVDVGVLGAQPGDTVTIEARGDGVTVRALVIVNPARATSTQYVEPIVLASAQALGHKLIWGTVSLIGQRQPLGGVTVELLRDGKVIASQVTPTGVMSPTFEIDPTANLAINTRLALRATYRGYRKTQTFTWLGGSVQLSMVLGWNCGTTISGRSGGGGDLPDNFCLTVTALLDGSATQKAQVIVSAPGRPDLVTTTGRVDGLPAPAAALDIGALVAGLPLDETLRITAIKDGLVGRAALRLADLGLGTAWGYDAALVLRGERTAASGLAGGTPAALAVAGSTVYAGFPGGGGVAARHGGTWISLLGHSPTALPSPEVTALLVLSDRRDDDWLLAGTRGGDLAFSRTSGRDWITLGSAFGSVTALARAADGSIFVADRQSVSHVHLDVGPSVALSPLGAAPALATPIAALAALPDGRLFAGASDGLWQLAPDGGSWTLARGGAVTALAAVPSGNATASLLVGTPGGLLICPGGVCGPAGLGRAVIGLASDQEGQRLYAATPDGIFEATAGQLRWRQTTSSDTLAGQLTTAGLPDVNDIVTIPGLAGGLVAATATGVYSSTNSGQNWAPVGVWPNQTPVRSVAALGDQTLLALTAAALVRWDGRGWAQVTTLPGGILNGAVVRASGDGRSILVGRNAGPGPSLYASADAGQAWAAISAGDDRGVSAIAFSARLGDGMQAIIGTDGDGVFGWSPAAPSALVQLPSLLNITQSARVGGLAVVGGGADCRIMAGTFGAPAQIAVRGCDSSSPWLSPAQSLTRADGAEVGLVSALAATDDGTLFAATSDGIFKGVLSGGWTPIFGVPLRPQTLLAPDDYASERLLLAGGPQTGVLLLSDTSPDVAVRLIAPREARAGDMLTYTVEARNLGLLPATSTALTLTLQPGLTLDPAGQTLTWTPGQLRSGEVFTTTVTARAVARNTSVRASLDAAMVAGEQFAANNHTATSTWLAYPIAPDPAVLLGGATMARPGVPETLHISFADLGDQPGGGMIQLVLPPDLPLGTITPRPMTSAPGLLTWQVAPAPGQRLLSFDVQYSLPAGLLADATLPVTVTLIPSGVDREPANNSTSARLRVAPAAPAAIVLLNWTRLGLLGPTDELRRQLDRYSRDTRALEIALDEGACAAGSTSGLPCLYAAYDDAIAAAAQPQSTSNDRFDAALAARGDLVARIKARVLEAAPRAPRLPLYIIGGDGVVPAAAVRETFAANQSQLPESAHLTDIDGSDSIYSVLARDAYLTDRTYASIEGRTFLVGRQPGSPEQIASVLRTYNQLGGAITIERGNVAGYAAELTATTQRQVCDQIIAAGLASEGCKSVPHDPRDGLRALAAGRTLSSLSGHSDERHIENLASLELQGVTPSQINLLLLLGCHTALAPAPDRRLDPTLTDVLAAQGQPSFGYTGYAYATEKTTDSTIIAYAGKLQIKLVDRLLQDDLTLGEVLAKAIGDYGAAQNSLDQKTLDTIALYGPPTYQVIITGAAARPARQASAQAGIAPDLVLTPSYTAISDPFGLRFQAQLNAASAIAPIDLVAQGHTVQPGADLTLGAAAHGLLLVDGAYHDITNVDPVIPRIAPLGASGPYTEPPYDGPRYDWATPAQVFLDGDGIPHARVPLGQWSPSKATERLFDAIHVRVLDGPDPTDRTPPRVRSVSLCRVDIRTVRVSSRVTADAIHVDVVLFDAGKIRVVRLVARDGAWTAEVSGSTNARYLIQAADANGNVAFATRGGRLYTLTTSTRCGD